ncbi:MAG TPA: hypothetical protein VIY10_16295 [Solirubrobacteraceae bacterium]
MELLLGGVELLLGGVELLLGVTELVDELLVAGGVLFVVALTLGLGLGGGACSAGTAPAPVNGVMLACCELPALDGASEDPVTAGADVFLTADPMAKAATSPITSAAANSSQRLRTS